MKKLLLISMALLFLGCGKEYHLAVDTDCSKIETSSLVKEIKNCLEKFKSVQTQLDDETFMSKCESIVRETQCKTVYSFYTTSLGFGSDSQSPHIPCSLTNNPEALEICPQKTSTEELKP